MVALARVRNVDFTVRGGCPPLSHDEEEPLDALSEHASPARARRFELSDGKSHKRRAADKLIAERIRKGYVEKPS